MAYNACRFCLSGKDCVPLFVEKKINGNLMQAIDLLALKVDENDGLPNAVCRKCYRIMVKYNAFEVKAMESYRILKDALTQNEQQGEAMEQESDEIIDIVTTEEETDVMSANGDDAEQQRPEPQQPVDSRVTAMVRHTVPATKEQCPVCKLLVTHLSKHLVVHATSEQYRCGYCDKLFLRDTSLREHLNIHGDIKNYRCHTCDARFTDRSSLRVHESKHRGDRKFCCDQCPAAFLTKSLLLRHVNETHRRREFQCNLCGRSFRMKRRMERHMKLHEKGLPLRCIMCESVYRTRKNLQKHVRKCHRKDDGDPTKKTDHESDESGFQQDAEYVDFI